jgi:hypothetical protein
MKKNAPPVKPADRIEMDKSTVYYLRAFAKLDSGEKFCWNFGGLFSFLWMFMRGMYWQGFCLMSLLLLGSLTWYPLVFGAILSILTALFGTEIYYGHVKSMIKKGYHLSPCHESRNYVLAYIIGLIYAFARIYTYDGRIEAVFILIASIGSIVFLLDYERKKQLELDSAGNPDLEISKKNIKLFLSKRGESSFGNNFLAGNQASKRELCQRIENGKIFTMDICYITMWIFFSEAFWTIFVFTGKMFWEAAILLLYYTSVFFLKDALPREGITSVIFYAARLTIPLMLAFGGTHLIYYRHIKAKSNQPLEISKQAIQKFTVATVCVFAFLLYCGTFNISDEEMLDHCLNKIEQVSDYKMSSDQRKEIHDFCKTNLFSNKDFSEAKKDDQTLREILKKKNTDLKFITCPTMLLVNGSSASHQAEFERIKQEFIKRSPTKITSDTEWAFIFHSRKNKFSDAICEWWNLVPAPPIKLWNKTTFVFYDCFQNQSSSPIIRNLSRIIYKHLDPLVSKWNDIKNSFMRI